MSDSEAYRRTMDLLIDEVWNKANLDILPQVFTENAVMHHGGDPDGGGSDMVGIETFREDYMRPTHAAFPGIRHWVKDLLIDGDRVGMRFQGEGTHAGPNDGVAPTNKVLRYEGIANFRMEGERIAEVWVQSNWAKQFAALHE